LHIIFKVLRPIQHKTDNYEDVLPSPISWHSNEATKSNKTEANNTGIKWQKNTQKAKQTAFCWKCFCDVERLTCVVFNWTLFSILTNGKGNHELDYTNEL